MNYFVIALGVAAYALNQSLFKASGPGFFHDHFNDVVAGALLLALASVMAGKGNPVARWVTSLTGSAAILAFASFVWEALTPRVLATARADPADVFAYFAGGLIYLAARKVGAVPWLSRTPGSRA